MRYGAPKKKKKNSWLESCQAKKEKEKEKIVYKAYLHKWSHRERESCEAKKEKEKKFVTHAHVPTCTGDLTERETHIQEK